MVFMVKRGSIEFVHSNKPIAIPITKFGGQPVWVGEPQWPLSKSTGNPMRFICQIAIDPAHFSITSARMAYLFMTDEEDYVDGTWEPDGGENAVVLQPGEIMPPIRPLTEGPTLYRMVQKAHGQALVPETCEFSVVLKMGEDPDFVDEPARAEWDKAKADAYASALDGNKIGGSPIYLQNTEFPGPGQWNLLLQLNSVNLPFHVNFGDAGIGYLFLSENGQTAKFLWQCG
jgi:uncharacterized protein YwqG